VTSVAKKQAQSLTTVVSASSAVRVASVASFDPRGYWEAYLEDPPGSPAGRASLTDGPLLAAYYRPLVAAQAGAGDSQITEENGMTMAQLPGIDLVLGICAGHTTALFEALYRHPATSRADITGHTGLSRQTVSTVVEELEQAAVAFVDAADGVGLRGCGVGEENKAAAAAAGGAFEFAEVAVRAGAASSEPGQQLGFEIGRDGVFEALGFVVNFPPLHAKQFGEHALNQVMTQGELAGDFASCGGELDQAIALHADEAVFFQATQGHRDRGRRHFEQVGEACRDDVFAFALRLEDRLQVVFLGDGDHWRDYTY